MNEYVSSNNIKSINHIDTQTKSIIAKLDVSDTLDFLTHQYFEDMCCALFKYCNVQNSGCCVPKTYARHTRTLLCHGHTKELEDKSMSG